MSRRLAIQWWAVAVMGGLGSMVHADLLIWNGGAGGVWQDGGSGGQSGGSPDVWDNALPDSASFTGTAPTTVSIAAGGVTVGDLTVSGAAYGFAGPGTLTLTGGDITVGAGLASTMTVALAGSSGFTKTGEGTLVLAGANKNVGGTLVVEGGAIQVAGVGNGFLGSSSNAAVRLDGGALHGNFAANVSPAWSIEVGPAGGELRNLNTGRWQMNQANRLSGSGTLTLSFGTANTRYELTAAQSTFAGKWVLDSAGNNNRFFDITSGFSPGTATGDDVYTLRQASLLLRDGVVLGATNKGILLVNGTSRIGAAGGNTATIAGRISGGVSDHLELSLGNSNSVLILSNPQNNWQGNTIVRTDAASGDLRGTVRLGASDVIPNTGGNVTLNTGVVLDLNGFNETIGGLDGSGRVISSTGSATLTVGANGNSPTFNGTIADGGGQLALTKVGAGIQSLGGTNTYSGVTVVSGGTLKLNAGSSISNTPSITIASNAVLNVASLAGGLTLRSGQTLGGEGEVVGSLTVGNGATLDPGSSPGFLIVDSLTLASGSRLLIDINGTAVPGVDYDRVFSDGSLTYQAGWTLEVSFASGLSGTHTVRIVDFATYNGTANAPVLTYNESEADNVSFNAATGELTFTGTLVPEPASLMLMLIGGWLLRMRRTVRGGVRV